MLFDFIPFYEGQVYKEAPRGRKLIQCLELPLELKEREIGNEGANCVRTRVSGGNEGTNEYQSSLVELMNDYLETHLGTKIPRDRVCELTSCSYNVCLK